MAHNEDFVAKVRFWRQGEEFGNFGDYIAQILLDHILEAPVVEADIYHLIGSVIDEGLMRQNLLSVGDNGSGKVAFWGCGLRYDAETSPWMREHGLYCGIRGPLSRDRLKLPPDTPLGDPGLLLPLLMPRRNFCYHASSLCLMHTTDPMAEESARERTGADLVRRATIPATSEGFLELLSCILGARFILTGALHGAIIAFAYGIPFAFLDLGFVDCPFKWRDFSASVGIEPIFVSSVASGYRVYEKSIAPVATPLPLKPILRAAPFSLRPAWR